MFVQRFVAWSATACAQERAQAIADLAKTYIEDRIIPEEKRDTEQVFTLYLDDPEIPVRVAMARALAPSERAPRVIIRALAQDIAEVAAEVFCATPLLRSADLAHAAANGEDPVQEAIARRDDIEAETARLLVEKGCSSAVLALLDNDSLVLGPGLKHDIAQRLGGDHDIRARLLEEDDLLPATRQTLVQQLASALFDMTTDRNWVMGARASAVANDASDRVAIEIAAESQGADMQAYVRHLRDSGRLTPALLIRAICIGNAALFEAAIAVLSGASLKRVQAIVDEGRVSAFGSLYSRTGLPTSAYSVFTAAIQAWQSAHDARDVIESVISSVEADESIDGELLALLDRMNSDIHRQEAQNVQPQLLLTAA